MHRSRDLILKELPETEFPETWALLKSGVADGVAPGMVAGFWRTGDPSRIYVAAHGQRRVFPSQLPLTPETVFDVASISKVFATATLAALLVERRWLRWDTRLAAIIPGYPHEEITIAHLLSHTAGFIAWEPYWERLRARFAPNPVERVPVAERQRAMREMILAVSPEVPAGTRALYSDVSFLLLGFALEEVTQLPLDRAVRELLWNPMGIEAAHYYHVTRSAEDRIEQIAATEDSEWRGGVLQGQVHDDNCWAMGGYAGHAGVFTNAREILHFAGRLLGGFLSRETLVRMWTRADRPAGCERTLGWDTPSTGMAGPEPSASRLFSPRSVGHLGYTGTSLWIDPEAGLAVTLLTNRVHPTRTNEKIKAFRPRFHEILRRELSLS